MANNLGTHRQLDVWQKSMDLVVDIYKLTASFPPEERFGLTSQMRRSAVSVPSNISEGAARKNSKEYVKFLYISLSSLIELETHLDIALRLSYVDDAKHLEMSERVADIRRMLSGLIRSITQKFAA